MPSKLSYLDLILWIQDTLNIIDVGQRILLIHGESIDAELLSHLLLQELWSVCANEICPRVSLCSADVMGEAIFAKGESSRQTEVPSNVDCDNTVSRSQAILERIHLCSATRSPSTRKTYFRNLHLPKNESRICNSKCNNLFQCDLKSANKALLSTSRRLQTFLMSQAFPSAQKADLRWNYWTSWLVDRCWDL